MINDKKAISKEFNIYFRDIGRSLHDQIVNKYPNASAIITVPERTNSIFLLPTSNEEICIHIDSLKPNNNLNDYVSASSLKKNKHILAPIISQLINECFTLGQFPDELKCSRIVPILKSGYPHNMSNYRPISILPSLSKLVEKTIYSRINSFFQHHGLIHGNQFGFQQKSSTLSATASLINHIQKSLHRENNIAGCVFIDLKKAFDTVPHNILLSKLHNYGIRGNAYKLIQSYLNNRCQYVDIDGIHSDILINENCFSLPQGSNLGPFLFLVYINDIFSLKLNGTIILFADDAVLTYTHYDKSILQTKLQEDIKKIHEWLLNNRLTLNADKTKYMLIKNNNNANVGDFKLSIDHNELERVVVFKYLGVTIRENLKWNTHVDNICGRVLGLVGAVKRLGNKLYPSTKIAFYHSMINSIMTYLIPVWATSINESHLKKLQVVQNKAIRAVFSYEYRHLNYSTSMIRHKYGILNIKQSINFACSILMYKIENRCIKINHIIERNNAHQYPTRGRNTPRLDAYRTNNGRLNLFRICTAIYNELSFEIKNENTLGKFMKKLKTELLNET